jgi:hypothetical protein
VLTYAGVLEHVRNLRECLAVASGNENVKYIFFSVPTISLSTAIGIVFPNVFNRLLNGWHTHLFSEESLNYMYDEYNLQPIAKWDFGTDMNDLLRSLVVTLAQKNASEKFIDQIDKMMRSNLDNLQLIVDKSGLCAETHIVCKRLFIPR